MGENGSNTGNTGGNGAGFSVPATQASLLLACLVDETVFLPTRSGSYPTLVGARFETAAPVGDKENKIAPGEVTLKVAVMVEVQETGPVRLEFAVLNAQNELMVNAFSDLFLEAGQHLNVTPVRALFDTAGRYVLGVAVNGQRSFFPLEVVPEPMKAKTEAKP
jgi:hypothetical protein